MHRPVVADAETVIRIRWNFLYDAVCVKLSSERTYEGSQPFFYFHFFSFLFLFRFSFLFLFIVLFLFLFLFKKCSPFKKCSIFQKCSYFQKMFDFHKFVRVFKFCSGVSENCLCFQFFLPAVANYPFVLQGRGTGDEVGEAHGEEGLLGGEALRLAGVAGSGLPRLRVHVVPPGTDGRRPG